MNRRQMNRILNEEFDKEMSRKQRSLRKGLNESWLSTGAGALLGGVAGYQGGGGWRGALNGAMGGVALEGLAQIMSGNIDLVNLFKIYQGSDNLKEMYDTQYKKYVGLNFNDFLVMLVAVGAMVKMGTNFNAYVGAVKNAYNAMTGNNQQMQMAQQQPQQMQYQQQPMQYQQPVQQDTSNFLGNMMGNALSSSIGGMVKNQFMGNR